MKILLSGYHNPHFITITEYIEEATQRLGHEVIIFDDRRHLIPGRARYRFKRLNELDLLFINRNFLSLALDTKPQLVVVTGGFRISGESIRRLRKEGIMTLLWTTDPPVHFEPVEKSAPFYDVVCCQGTEAIEILKSVGVAKARWLPMACEPTYHRPVQVTQNEDRVFGSQVVFVGSYQFCREKLFENLREFDFAIWGPGWGRLAKESCLRSKVKGGKVPPEQWVKIYGACNIILTPHFQDEHNRFPVHQISTRVFEAMACGGFVLSDRQKDVLALFKDGEHLVTFGDGKDLVDKIKHFLQHPEERKRIAAAGRREVLNKHTYTHRIQSLLSLIRRPESEPSRGGISNCGRQREQVINFDQIPLESRTMQKRHKVVHIVEDLKVGGLEKIIAAIATGLDPKKFDVEIWCLARGGAVADWLRQSGISVKILNLSSYHRPLNIARLSLRLRRSRADIVHTHGNFASTFGRLAAIIACIRRVVVHVHTSDFSLSRRHILIEKFLACFTRRIICVSRSVQDFVKNVEGVCTDKTSVIYNGTAMLFGENGEPMLRSTLGIADEDCVAISVGSLVENKGHRVLIDALRILVPLHPRLILLIAGDGPLRTELEEYVRRSQLSVHVRFMGIVKDIHCVLKLADIFILPSRYREGLPLAVLEAMQHGLAVIATKIGGVPEAVEHDRSGLLVPPGDAWALKDAMAKLATDGNLRQGMGRAGRKRYEECFRAEQMVSQIESLYREMTTGDERFAV